MMPPSCLNIQEVTLSSKLGPSWHSENYQQHFRDHEISTRGKARFGSLISTGSIQAAHRLDRGLKILLRLMAHIFPVQMPAKFRLCRRRLRRLMPFQARACILEGSACERRWIQRRKESIWSFRRSCMIHCTFLMPAWAAVGIDVYIYGMGMHRYLLKYCFPRCVGGNAKLFIVVLIIAMLSNAACYEKQTALRRCKANGYFSTSFSNNIDGIIIDFSGLIIRRFHNLLNLPFYFRKCKIKVFLLL